VLKGKGRFIAIPQRAVSNDAHFPLPFEKGTEIDVQIKNKKSCKKKFDK